MRRLPRPHPGDRGMGSRVGEEEGGDADEGVEETGWEVDVRQPGGPGQEVQAARVSFSSHEGKEVRPVQRAGVPGELWRVGRGRQRQAGAPLRSQLSGPTSPEDTKNMG